MTMHRNGVAIAEIRTFIDETYQSFGIGTDTPMPPAGP